MTTRREFLVKAGAVTAGAAAGMAMGPAALGGSLGRVLGQEKKLKLLILGGTGLLGPQVIRRAVASGHEIAMFNRGRTGPNLFPDIEHLQGDRYTDLSALEKAVADGREWDAVIDTFTYVPKTVTDAMDVLLPAMGQFIVISTISVYDNPEPGADEGSPLAQVDDAAAAGITSHREVGQHYGAMKARVEKAAEERFPGKVCVIRPGLICGERDTTGRYSYWPMRAREGGTMIGPGDGTDFVQYHDVRDLGKFTVTCAEKRLFETYTVDSPADARTARSMIDAAIRAAGATPEVEWIPSEFLAEQGVQYWQEMPVWIPNSEMPGRGRMSVAKALAAGLTIRPEEDTARSVLEYVRTRGPEIRAERGDEVADQWPVRIRGGLDAAREAEVLAAWRDREG
ncbi:MAG: isoflavone reductase [Phycisphaeraceae bacterium]|nr:MAG: isoflavone reductase [Phycisphaeraceae bacterium]